VGAQGGTTVLKAYAAIKRREKQPGIYHDKVKDFAISLSGKALKWFHNDYFFVFFGGGFGVSVLP
jgi:hypothetical protein